MQKIDLKKELKHLYQPSAREVVQVDVPTLRYLMFDGEGNPNTSQDYAQGVEALFAVSYTAKFMVKKGPQALDYAVMPLEGLWWAHDMSSFVTGEEVDDDDPAAGLRGRRRHRGRTGWRRSPACRWWCWRGWEAPMRAWHRTWVGVSSLASSSVCPVPMWAYCSSASPPISR